MKKTLVWAHRGASGWDKQYAAENTMLAFERANEMGADGVELDVQLTRDGEVVICHDEYVDRTSDGKGPIRSYTLAELRELDFSKPHPEQGITRIPTLREFLDFLRGTDMTVNIELKTSVVLYPGIEEKTASLVHEFGLEERVWYSSFNHESVKIAMQYAPHSHFGFLFAQPILDMPAYTARYGAEALHPARGMLDVCPDLIAKSHAAGRRVHVWVVDPRVDMAEMVRRGVDVFFTDCPDNARKIVDEMTK